ncbi:MAG: Trk K+ transport system NAD-binding subunit [Cryomorphaceae bacterium]|jgi:voltage-gated potassium channel Kch
MQKTYAVKDFPWLSTGALFFFFSALIGFGSGVSVSERPELATSGLLIKAYYSLSLFVVGGVDLGTPIGGTTLGRFLVWISYFGSPVLAAWGLIGTLVRALAPQSWQLKRLKNHIIVVGDGELATSYLRVLRQVNQKITVVVVSGSSEQLLKDEFEQNFGAIVVSGDITHDFFLCELKVELAKKILLLDDNSLRSYEAASVLINLIPGIADKVVIHCASLRFMRSMENTRVANSCETFNTYHLAAAGLVRSHMLHHFRETRSKDIVIMAGFGRFGQTILEELQRCAADELDTVLIIDKDVHRRVMVADEQIEFSESYRREQFEGDISNPEVWERIRNTVNIDGDNTVFVMGTGYEEQNLRTALWLRRQYPGAMVISRSSKQSLFAAEVGEEHNIISISIAELLEQNIPSSWVDVE